jgi:hypothetical protein
MGAEGLLGPRVRTLFREPWLHHMIWVGYVTIHELMSGMVTLQYMRDEREHGHHVYMYCKHWVCHCQEDTAIWVATCMQACADVNTIPASGRHQKDIADEHDNRMGSAALAAGQHNPYGFGSTNKRTSPS